MVIAAMAESRSDERRVALTPDVARLYSERGWRVRVQAGAGVDASFPDRTYAEAGASVAKDVEALLDGADAVLKVQPPTLAEVAVLEPGSVLVGHLDPLDSPSLARALAARGVTSFAVELVPRATRAQSMDALSSQATVAGYVAVLEGARLMTRFLPMLTTAAGTIRPAKALILGAGVAGLQAIATARRLGAVVSAFDVRPAVEEQVRSLGARFLSAPLEEEAEDAGGYATSLSAEQHLRELDVIARRLPEQDLVVTTARIPGAPAPILITEEMVDSMRPGSVVVDLAADAGGNCALTVPGRTVRRGGALVTGPANLASELPDHASRMYARNLAALLVHLYGDDGEIDPEDEIAAATCVTRNGEIANDRLRARRSGEASSTSTAAPAAEGSRPHG